MTTQKTTSHIRLDVDDIAGVGEMSGKTWATATAIPVEVIERIPNAAMAVPLLLTQALPIILDPSTILPPAVTCVVSSQPIWNVESLMESPIPPSRWRSDAENSAREFWVERKEEVGAFQHPTNTVQLFPLWVMEFWGMMVRVVTEQTRWRNALEWIQNREDCPQRSEVLNLIGRVPWGLNLWTIQGFVDPDRFIGRMADLLSFKWVDETHMAAVAAYLNVTGSANWWAGDAELSNLLKLLQAVPDNEVEVDSFLPQIRAAVTKRGATNIIMPVHVNENHWIVAHVNLTNRRLSCGAFFNALTTHHSPSFGILAFLRRLPRRTPEVSDEQSAQRNAKVARQHVSNKVYPP